MGSRFSAPHLSAPHWRTRTAILTAALGLGALGALGAWSAVLATAWPRLTALGGICGRSTGAWALSGHCPACPLALTLTAAFVVAVACLRGAPEAALSRVRA